MCFKPTKDKHTEASAQIEAQLKQEKKSRDKIPTLLLLGAGNAGKSTFCRQLLFLNQIKPSESEMAGWIPIFQENTIVSAQTLIKSISSEVKLQALLTGLMSVAVQKKILESAVLDLSMAKSIEALATKEIDSILDALEADGVVLVAGAFGARHFFRNATQYFKQGYKPTQEDLLCARKKTTGISQYDLQHQGNSITIIDVGGQKSERRKWIHQFDTATAVIFLVATNEYDQTLEEEEGENRIVDSIKMFRALSSSFFLKDKPFILFLNKADLFKKKIERVPLDSVFEGFEEFEKSSKSKDKFLNSWKFLAAQFTSKFSGTGSLTVHLTSAVDTESCKKVWDVVATHFLLSKMSEAGIM